MESTNYEPKINEDYTYSVANLIKFGFFYAEQPYY